MLRLMNDSIHALPQIFNSLNRLCVRPILPTPFPSLGCQSSLEFDGDVIIIVRFSRTHCFTRGRMEPWRYPSFPPQNVSDMHPLGDHRHSLPPHPRLLLIPGMLMCRLLRPFHVARLSFDEALVERKSTACHLLTINGKKYAR